MARDQGVSLTKIDDERRKALFTPTVLQELQAIETDLGGRRAVVGLLVLAPLTQDLQYVLGQLGDPRNDRTALATICARANVLPGKLIELLAGAAMARGKVQASQRIGLGMAAVAEDIMRRAAPYTAPCYQCRGTGTVVDEPTKEHPNPSPGPCGTCQGVGELTYLPDLDRQKLAIEMAQLLPKGGGISIANINAPGSPPADSAGMGTLERLQQATDQILYGSGSRGAEESPAVDGEVTDADAGTDAPQEP